MGCSPHPRRSSHELYLIREYECPLGHGEPDSEVATMTRFLISLGCNGLTGAATIEDSLLSRARGVFLESLTGGEPVVDYPLLPASTPDTPRPELGTARQGGH